MIKNTGTVMLRTKRLTLRRFERGDADAMYKNWGADPAVSEKLQWERHASPEESENLIAGWCAQYQYEDYYNWAIEYEGDAVGNVAVHALSEKHMRAELGYCLGSRFWGRGIMTEAVGAVIAHLICEVGLNCICAMHRTDNPASGRVMAKCGMKPCGVLPSYAVIKGEPRDLCVHIITANDWRGVDGQIND